MKRFVEKTALFWGIQAGLFIALLAFYSRETDSFVASAIDKHRWAASAPPPRMLLIGGSATAFGTVSPLLARATGRHVVNLGGHAGQGFEYRLAEAKHFVRRGDEVLVSFEYETLVSPHEGSALTLLRTAEASPRCLRYFSGRDWKEILDNGSVFIRHMLRRTKLRLTNGAWPRNEPPYSRDSFNKWGDVVAHYHLPPEHRKGARIHIRRNWGALHRRIREMDRFVSACSARGARCFYFFPAIPRSSWDIPATREGILTIAHFLKGELVMPILNAPGDVVFPDRMFWDTTYHLTKKGAEKRTMILAALLRGKFGEGRRPRDASLPCFKPFVMSP